MQKSLILSLISKYNTIGNIESVIWEIAGDQLKTKFISDDKSMIGEVKVFGFKSEDNGAKLGIYKSSQFVKLLSPLSNEISPFQIEKIGDKLISVKLNDQMSKMNYALSDLAVIPHVPSMKHVPQNFEVSFKIDDDFSNVYTKALSALPDVEIVSVKTTDTSMVSLTLGQTDVNTNRFNIEVENLKEGKLTSMFFNARILAEIISANKGVEAEFEISSEGLAKIKFETKEYSALYYLVAKRI